MRSAFAAEREYQCSVYAEPVAANVDLTIFKPGLIPLRL